MKPRLSWILLAIYLNASAQTIFPFVQDCFAHLFLWKDHLEQVHHGHIHSHHVADQIATEHKQSNDQHPAGHTNIQGEKDTLSAHLAPERPLQTPHLLDQTVLLDPFWLFFHQNICSEVIIPPPDRA